MKNKPSGHAGAHICDQFGEQARQSGQTVSATAIVMQDRLQADQWSARETRRTGRELLRDQANLAITSGVRGGR